jgi:phenylacetate-CoA ligase
MKWNDHLMLYWSTLWRLREISQNQWLRAERLEVLQNERLRRMTRHAYEKVPFYRQLFEGAGIRPEDISTCEDLKKIPVTSREAIKGSPAHDLVDSSAELSRCIPRLTSGSTGIPLTIYKNYDCLITVYCLHVRALKQARFRLRDKILVIGPTYYPVNLLPQKMGVGRVKIVSPVAEMEELVSVMNSYKPDVLHCYPSVYKSLIAFLRSKRIMIHRPKIIISSAEFLDDRTCGDIEEVFGSRPFQWYGSMEIGRIGSECFCHNGIHLNADVIVPEFIPVNVGDGLTAYRMVLTSLYSFTMPFIRYDQGDLVEIIREPCSCGMQFPRIRILDSRKSDVIYLPDGKLVSALRLTGVFLSLPGVYQFKIIQESRYKLVAKVIKTEQYSEEAAKAKLQEIDSILPGVRTEIEIVRSLEREPSGKIVQFESNVHKKAEGSGLNI